MDKPTMRMLSVQGKGGKTRRSTQYLAAIAGGIGAIIAGTILSWTSPALPQLQPWVPPVNGTNATVIANTTLNNATGQSVLINTIGLPAEFLLSTRESSMVSSVLAIGAAATALPAGFLASKWGRKPTILVLAIPFTLNWLLIIFANGPGMLIAARIFAGIGTGGICVAGPMYMGEVGETAIRGTLGSFFQLFLSVGILFTFVVGGVTHWKTFAIIAAVLPPLLVAVFWWMPETPQYLLSKNRRREAERSLRWLRGPDADLTAEMEEMQKDVEQASQQRAGLLNMVRNRAPRNGLICALGLMLVQQFSGINAVIFYTNNIFQSAGSNIAPTVATIIVGIVQTVFTYVSSILIEKAGRRILLLQSCVIVGLCLVVLGVYFKLQRDLYDVSPYGWLPLLCLVLFIVSFSMGLGPIPWMIMAELFSVEYRGAATGVTVVFNWVLTFVVTLFFPIMKDGLGIYSCFFFFCVCTVGALFFVFFLVPETKGKTISQIQAILGAKKA